MNLQAPLVLFHSVAAFATSFPLYLKRRTRKKVGCKIRKGKHTMMKQPCPLSPRRSLRRTSHLFLSTLFLIVGLLVGAYSFAPAAHAAPASPAQASIPYGSNGQQLEVRTLAASVNVNGYNQNGEEVHHCFDTPDYDTYLSGWWWKGNMEIWSYNGTGCQDPTNDVTFVTVPTKFYDDFFPVKVLPWD